MTGTREPAKLEREETAHITKDKIRLSYERIKVKSIFKGGTTMKNTILSSLNTIDGETLMNRPLQPLSFVVDTLISQGLHILAGSPKVGKSWLALWLAVAVAKGEPVWGMQVKQGTTLYLCLEDSQLRIQNRLFDVTEDAPASVHFCTESCILGDGLMEQLEEFLREHPDTSLIIIDTLQMMQDNWHPQIIRPFVYRPKI